LQAVIDGILTYLLGLVGQRIIANLRKMLWRKIVRLPVPYFDKIPTGNTVSRVINDSGILKDLITQHFPQFVGGIISIIGAITILLIMDWKMTVIMLLSVPLMIVIIMMAGTIRDNLTYGLHSPNDITDE